jgi:hypothetical protein
MNDEENHQPFHHTLVYQNPSISAYKNNQSFLTSFSNVVPCSLYLLHTRVSRKIGSPQIHKQTSCFCKREVQMDELLAQPTLR